MPQTAAPNPLDQLKGIHTPTDVSAWPLAWGWWGIIIAVILLIVSSILLWKRYRQFALAKRQALVLVEQIDPEAPDAIATLNQILKRVSRHYDSASNVASMYGDQWTIYLMKRLPEKHQAAAQQPFTDMNTLLYQKSAANSQQTSKIKVAVSHWIRHANIYSFSLRRSVREPATHV